MTTSNSTMKALRVHEFGPSPLKLDHIPIPSPGHKQILVTVKAIGVNPRDQYIASGLFAIKPPVPYIPGTDGAGVVEAIGPEVTKFKAGDKVFFWQLTAAAFAEKVVVDETFAGSLRELSFEQGAAIGWPYFTAIRAIQQLGSAKSGQTLFIHGASGGVGVAAIQFGKSLGMRVIGTAGTDEGIKLVKTVGADLAFNHNDKDYVQHIKEQVKEPIDLIIENLADKNINVDLDIIGQNGKILCVGCRGGMSLNGYSPLLLLFKEVSIIGLVGTGMSTEQYSESFQCVSAGTAANGWVRPVIGRSYKLSDGTGGGNNALHDVIAQPGGSHGKLVIVP